MAGQHRKSIHIAGDLAEKSIAVVAGILLEITLRRYRAFSDRELDAALDGQLANKLLIGVALAVA